MQQTICRKVNLFLEILLSTPMIREFIESLVKILEIYDNPQITKARSGYFKLGIKELTSLSMLVGISEAIRLLSTVYLRRVRGKINHINFSNFDLLRILKKVLLISIC